MGNSLLEELRDQIRGIVGALLVAGLTFHYTMETWWLGWTLPMSYLLTYAVVGLAGVVAITRIVGFHRAEQNGENRRNPRWTVLTDSTEILLQSFVASYVILLVLGVVDLDSSLEIVVRLGFIEVVPLGFGAAMANRLFGSTSQSQAREEMQFPENVALFVLGAVFIASTIAPTREIELIAAHMGWFRFPLLVVLSVALVYLFLYELGMQGQQNRMYPNRRLELGTAFLVYFVGAVTSFFLLTGFGHFTDATVEFMYQETVVLAFPASLGAAAAQVVV